jgi:hypothetical protein
VLQIVFLSTSIVAIRCSYRQHLVDVETNMDNLANCHHIMLLGLMM